MSRNRHQIIVRETADGKLTAMFLDYSNNLRQNLVVTLDQGLTESYQAASRFTYTTKPTNVSKQQRFASLLNEIGYHVKLRQRYRK